jgi:hypothetical protein
MTTPVAPRATKRFIQLLLLLSVCVFLPAGTLDYWEGWLFCAVFPACSLAMTLYLAVNDPQLLEQRMQIGPAAETERSQKIIIVAVLLVLAATPAVSATDHRLGWSSVPAVVVVLGDLLAVLAHIGFCLVFRANTWCCNNSGYPRPERHLHRSLRRHPPPYVCLEPSDGLGDSTGPGLMVGDAYGGPYDCHAGRKNTERREIFV